MSDDAAKKRLADMIGKLTDRSHAPIEEMLKGLLDEIHTCKACHQKNRVKPGRAGKPRCGKCGLPL